MESIALQRREDACWKRAGACRLIGGCLSETGRRLPVDRRTLVGDGQALVGR